MAFLPSGASQLDGPPPSPDAQPMSMRGAAPPIYPEGSLPPDVLMTIMQSGAQFVKIIDLWAQSLPALAPDFDVLKTQVNATLAKVAQVGGSGTAPATSDVEPGQNFPGASTPLGPSGAQPMGMMAGR
jgi:hypothetical protein